MAENLTDDTLSVSPFSIAPSTDTARVQIQIKGTRWSIPRNFLETANLTRGFDEAGHHFTSAAVRIVLSYPELNGATPSNIKCFKPLSTKNCSNVILMHLLRSNENIKKRNGPAIDEAASLSSNYEFGLTKVTTKISLEPQDVYVYYGGSYEKSVVIGCIKTDVATLNGCSVRIEAFGLPILYHYELGLLPHWREIHDKVTSLLTSFHAGVSR